MYLMQPINALRASHRSLSTDISSPLLTQHHLSSLDFLPSIARSEPSNKMGDEVKIDRDTFNNRLSHFVSTWKGDKRQSNDALFGGVGSIVVLLGRNEESLSFQKNNAMHVCATTEIPLDIKSLQMSLQFWLLGYEFPATLMVFTLESLYIVTTSKKGTLQPSCS